MANNSIHKIEKLAEIYSRRIRNKKTTKGLIMASFDDSSLKLKKKSKVDNIVRNQVNNERKSGNFYLNHLILRDSTAEIDNLKFLYPIDGIPTIAYVLMNLVKSDLRDIAVVGNKDIKDVVDAFIDLYKPKQEISFEDEGSIWGIDNTLLKGRNLLKSDNELVLICPGDVPFLYDVNKIIRNRFQKRYQGVFNLNTKKKNGKYFPRNYHMDVSGLLAKECNPSLVDLNAIPYDLIKIVYSNYRKFYASEESRPTFPIKKKDMFDFVREYIREPAVKRAIPKIVSMVPGANRKLKAFSFLMKQYTRVFDRKGVYRISLSALQDALCLILNMKGKVLLTNNDPATLEDLDSYEDWCFMNKMMQEGKSDIYFHYDEIQKFKQVTLKKISEEYINSMFENFGLFGQPYYEDETHFLLRPPYNSKNELDIEFVKSEVNEMIKNNNRFHHRYLMRYSAKLLFRKEYK